MAVAVAVRAVVAVCVEVAVEVYVETAVGTSEGAEVPVEAAPVAQVEETPAPVQPSKPQYGGKQSKYDKRR